MREKTKSFVHASVCLCDKLMETIFIWVMFPAQSGLKGGGASVTRAIMSQKGPYVSILHQVFLSGWWPPGIRNGAAAEETRGGGGGHHVGCSRGVFIFPSDSANIKVIYRS